jgi:hypothetical protein
MTHFSLINRRAVTPLIVALCGILLTTPVASGHLSGSEALSSQCKPGVSVTVTTNVNQFTLSNSLTTVAIRPCSMRNDSSALHTKRFWYNIPVRNFKADHHQIYRDFQTLLKAEQYPEIHVGIYLIDLHRMLASASVLTFPVEIKMAGSSKTYQITSQISRCNGRTLVSGDQIIKLTDFNIQPPNKLLGLIRVHNEIVVNFDFVLTVV